MKIIGGIVCRLRRKHANATFEFIGSKPDFSSPEGCLKGIPVYKVSCPRCGASVEMGEDELAKEVIKALESGNYRDVEVIQYSSGYRPQNN